MRFCVMFAGEYERIEISSQAYAHIQANRPVQVYQYVKTTANKDTDNADPAMMVNLNIFLPILTL